MTEYSYYSETPVSTKQDVFNLPDSSAVSNQQRSTPRLNEKELEISLDHQPLNLSNVARNRRIDKTVY